MGDVIYIEANSGAVKVKTLFLFLVRPKGGALSSSVLHGVLSSLSALHGSSAAFLLYSGMSPSHSCSSSRSLYLSISLNASFPAEGLVACVDRPR